MSSLAQELKRLRALKDTAEQLGREKKEADARFKAHQQRCLQHMQAQEAESFRTNGYLYTAIDDKVKGRVEDRREYVRWALENDEAILDFMDWAETWRHRPSDFAKFKQELLDSITSTSVVQYKESQMVLNQQARSHLDDGAPLPPGMTFDPDPAIQMRRS